MSQIAIDVGKVGVLMGGTSSEREISLRSGRAITEALRHCGVEVIEIGEKGDIQQQILKEKIDFAFIALHGREGEDGSIQAFLQEYQIPYTGSDVSSSRLAMDKVDSKKKLQECGILTPRFHALCAKIDEPLQVETFPVVVKPSCEGSSFGMSVVRSEVDLPQAIKNAFKFDERILVEEFVKGRELTVGILGDQALPPLEIKPKSGIYDFHAKYTVGATEYVVPAPVSKTVATQLQQVALKVHAVFGCQDFSRVDFILDRSGNAFVLELNTIPGFTQTSLLPKSALSIGIRFEELCLRILELAVKRTQQKATP